MAQYTAQTDDELFFAFETATSRLLRLYRRRKAPSTVCLHMSGSRAAEDIAQEVFWPCCARMRYDRERGAFRDTCSDRAQAGVTQPGSGRADVPLEPEGDELRRELAVVDDPLAGSRGMRRSMLAARRAGVPRRYAKWWCCATLENWITRKRRGVGCPRTVRLPHASAPRSAAREIESRPQTGSRGCLEPMSSHMIAGNLGELPTGPNHGEGHLASGYLALVGAIGLWEGLIHGGRVAKMELARGGVPASGASGSGFDGVAALWTRIRLGFGRADDAWLRY